MRNAPASVSEVTKALAEVDYLADEPAALVSFLAQRLGKPILVEGPAGVGKTELAKALSRATGRDLIRLQCYEGLDESKALYEWNYRKQLLRIQAGAASGDADAKTAEPGAEAVLSGTAAALSPVGRLVVDGAAIDVGSGQVGPNAVRLRDALREVQTGVRPDPGGWLTEVSA